MTFSAWVAAVLKIARDRGINVSVSYPNPGWVTFNWVCQNGAQYGSCGAGADLVALTTPEAFTWLWTCPLKPPPPPIPVSPDPWKRRGRFVPRVPAMAVAKSLKVLFNV